MRIDRYVAEVMEQLRDFVPDGGEVRFEIAPIAEDTTNVVCDVGYRDKREKETIVFTVPMTGSRVAVPATLRGHQS